MQNRQQLRTELRQRRMALSASEQQQAASALVTQVLQHPSLMAKQHIALYLSNDGEINTTPLIAALLDKGKNLYLPILHPVVPGYLLFQHYDNSTLMRPNRFGIAEPAINCSQIIPVAELDVIFTPLVAFDEQGNRLGMGGGFYDRTLSQLPDGHSTALIGLAHQCQRVPQLPVAAWDQPLNSIITPTKCYHF